MIKRNKQLLIKLSEEEDEMVKEIRNGGMNVSQLIRNSIEGYYNNIVFSNNGIGNNLSQINTFYTSSSAQLTG